MKKTGRQVIVAKTAGFCFGVERAVNEVYEQLRLKSAGQAPGPIYTYGPIIHNEEVVRDLEEQGVRVLNTPQELKNLPRGEGTVIIRSHGVSKDIYELLKERGVRIVDATCPFVKKIHRIVEEHSGAGETVVMVTLDTESEQVYATDQTTESTLSEQQQTSRQETSHVLLQDGSGQQPLVETTYLPQVRGVAVVCQGGEDITVVTRITEAVSVVLDLPASRICVTKMN